MLNAYLEAVQNKTQNKTPGLITVPAQSTLGQWLELYRAQVEHPVVKSWLRDQKIGASTVLTVDPFKGTLSVEEDGKTRTFTLSDTSGWGQISGPLLAAAKVIAPENRDPLRVRLADGSTRVSAKVVANFQGIPLPETPSQANEQIKHLRLQNAFDPIPADDPIRPASKRSTHALAVQRQDAARFYLGAPHALEYKRLAVNVATQLPNTREEAKKWAEKLIFQLTGKHVDADTIFLNRFKTASTPLSADSATVTGWEHPGEEPYSSLRLPDALLKNFNEHDGVPGNLDLDAGLYLDGPGQSTKGGYGAHNQFPLAPSALMHASWKTDFQAEMTQKIDHFWSTQSENYEVAIKGEFVYQARKQLKANDARSPAERALQAPEHKFTRDDYRLVMGAASNLPVDEYAPLTIEQLKAGNPDKGTTRAHAFSLHGFTSSDMVRFSAADGRQVLSMPGAEPAFLRFDSLEKLNQWVVDQTKDPKKREDLLSHFPLIYRQDHEAGFGARAAKVLMPILWFTHVGEKTEGLSTLFDKMSTGKLKDPAIDDSHSKIEGDVFHTVTTSTKERMKSDADTVIKSNSEVIRDTWLNDITVAAGLLAKLAPIAPPVAVAAVITGLTELTLGAEKASSGDTEAERKDGASKAFDGVLNTLFSVGASGRVEDPFKLSEENPAAPPPGESPQVENPQPRGPKSLSDANRLQPSQAGNISAYAVPDGESLIENATRNGKGIYQVKDDVSGEDHWFIRYTDTSGIRQVFEIKGDFKLSNDYVQIINRDTGKPVMTVHATPDGEWARGLGPGGKWPWTRLSASPTETAKPAPKISDAFIDLEGKKLDGAEQIDEFLSVDDRVSYEYSIRNIEESGVIKAKLGISWVLPEDNFEVGLTETAGPSDFSSSQYSEQFTKDLSRFNYSVVVRDGTNETRTVLKSTANDGLEITAERLRQFEALIPDPVLRARISEVAHQGSLAPASNYLNQDSGGLKDGFYLGGKDTEVTIEYDAQTKRAKVHFVSTNTISQPDAERYKIPGVEITTKRTFSITESNEIYDADNTYVIDKHAPSNIELTLVVK
ncbi:dermonecrotic toxin domain-containing protein [Pseudomonas sp. SDO524_S393]